MMADEDAWWAAYDAQWRALPWWRRALLRVADMLGATDKVAKQPPSLKMFAQREQLTPLGLLRAKPTDEKL